LLCQAAGVVPIANNSGGPLLDIVLEYDHQKTGLLAKTVEEYASAMAYLLSHPEETGKIQEHAREHAIQKFSDEIFDKTILQCLSSFSPIRDVLGC